jgi:hypothetical protein
MDLKLLDPVAKAAKGADLHLRNPFNGAPLFLDDDPQKPVTWKLLGGDAEAYEKHVANCSKEYRMIEATREPSDEEVTHHVARMLSGAVLGWSNFRYGSDKPLKFDYFTALEILKEARWIRQQVHEFIQNRANFWKGPSAS